MYIIKNALRCIARSKGRNILIGIIALVIAISACLGLSIRQASENAKISTLEGMSVTATISYDRTGAMDEIGGNRPNMDFSGGMPEFDKDAFSEMMGNASSLTLEEYQYYATADSVQDFYYTLTAYFNGSESFSPVSEESDTDDDTDSSFDMGGMFPGFGGGMQFDSGDFTVIGYSSYQAMTAFMDGTASIKDGGSMFDADTSDYTCVISHELATFNSLDVGDTIVITNASSETETYTLTITGIYTSSENNDNSMSMFGASQDPVNRILMSANALQAIADASAEAAENAEEEDSVRAVSANLSATYVFANTDDYYAFSDQVRDMGLDESYSVSSTDMKAYEDSLAPLNTLSDMAGVFLIVILVIGGIILVVLNIFNVRERKYEVGVLTAMGMKKLKVAAQFFCEILVVTMVAVIIGAGVGAVSSVPVTNALLANQVATQNAQQDQIEQNFGFPGGMPGNMGGNMPSDIPDNLPDNMGGGKNPFGQMFDKAADYVTQIDSAMNLTVVFQMLGVGLLLTLIASAASVLFIMRYDPLKILANRD